jgi:hypothetical protein
MIVTYTQTDAMGKIRKWVTLSNGDTTVWKFDFEPSTALLTQKENEYLLQHQYDSVQEIDIDLYDDSPKFKEFIQAVKDRPTLTLAQYNTWLGLRPWNEQAVIRYFVYRLATILAQKADITLANLTETQVLSKLRDWIVATPIKKMVKILGHGITNDN